MAGLTKLEKIFKKKLNVSIRTWQNNTLIESKLERVHDQVLATVPEVTQDISKYGAVESLSRLIRYLSLRNKQQALQSIKLYCIKEKSSNNREKDQG